MEIACVTDRPITAAASIGRHTTCDGQDAGILITGSTWAAIWHMSWPLTLNMLALAAMNLFEDWIAGRLGTDAQAAMFIFSPHIAALLCANDDVAASCTQYLRIVCWTEPLFACWRILSGAMQGAGYTCVPMFATVFSFAILRISLAAVFLHLCHGSTNWIWVSMAASTVVAGLIMMYFWRRGQWQSQPV